jgi:hypothetical protein
MFAFSSREDDSMRPPPRFSAFLLVLLYTAVLVAGCFYLWSREQLDPVGRSLILGLSVIGWSWSMSEGMTVDQLLPRSGRSARKQTSA